MLNIVSGIIIDTFGSLREELQDFLDDQENYCFICGYDRELIEKSSKDGIDFNYHIKQEHYMWNYIFYLSHIKNKKETDYTGIESYVNDKYDAMEISWFPTGKALCLKGIEEN
jgi:hypothetical protein